MSAYRVAPISDQWIGKKAGKTAVRRVAHSKENVWGALNGKRGWRTQRKTWGGYASHALSCNTTKQSLLLLGPGEPTHRAQPSCSQDVLQSIIPVVSPLKINKHHVKLSHKVWIYIIPWTMAEDCSRLRQIGKIIIEFAYYYLAIIFLTMGGWADGAFKYQG